MAYRRYTHSFRCRNASVSGCLWAVQRQPEKAKPFNFEPNGFLLDRFSGCPFPPNPANKKVGQNTPDFLFIPPH
nr:hypothetical protein [uncultured Kingella sp.]